MTIGEKIRALRLENHMTQEKLARRLNVSPQTVSKWEQNITAPDILLLAEIADCFQVTTDELLGAGRYRKNSAYKTYRARLTAIYEGSGEETDFQRATAAFHDVLLQGNPTPEDYLLYGWMHEVHAKKDIRVALQYYAKASAAVGNDNSESRLKAQVQMSRLLCDLGHEDEAVDCQKKRQQQEPENIQVLLALLWTLYFAGRAEEALPYVTRAEQMAPENPYVLTTIGDILGGEKGLGRFDEALQYWERALQADEDFGDARYGKAYAYEQLGKIEAAVSEYHSICAWLRHRGSDVETETSFAEEKIRTLTKQQTNNG